MHRCTKKTKPKELLLSMETQSNVAKSAKSVTRYVLISQPKPEGDKSPYFDVAAKYNVELIFYPFIRLEPIVAREFRKQKLDLVSFTAVIFTSRNAIDHFFRMCEEMKVNMSQNTKYFCINEQVARYLQKFILYLKRKVFYGADGTNKGMLNVINKHKEGEKFLYVCSENQQDSEITSWLKKAGCSYELGFMYRTVSSDLQELFAEKSFSLIALFTPSGVKSVFDNFPDYQQGDTAISAFGTSTVKAAEAAGLEVQLKMPQPGLPSMAAALDKFLADTKAPLRKKK